jgi:hypothetical protein
VASPHWKHGRGSRYVESIPARLADGYALALADPDLCDLGAELALLATRGEELAERLGKAPPPPWSAALAALTRLEKARTKDGRGAALAALGRLLRQGAAGGYEAAWREVRELPQGQARVAAVEWKRMHELGALMRRSRTAWPW